MNFRPLEIFCSVAEHRNFSRAATSLEVTQSAVSQAISGLEASVGVSLIDRSKRPPELTAAGQTFLRGSRGILKTYERLVADTLSTQDAATGQISVGCVVSIGLTYMPDAMREFAQSFPKVRVNTAYGSSERVVEMVVGGEVDFGLVSFPQSTKDVEAVAWLDEPMRIICSDRHPFASQNEVSAADLSGTQMIGFVKSLRLRQEIESVLSEAGITVDFPMEFDNTDSMIRAIQATGGIGILPEAAVRRETADGRLRVIRCSDFSMTRPLGIAFRRGEKLSLPSTEFSSLLLGRSLETKPKRNNPGSVSIVA